MNFTINKDRNDKIVEMVNNGYTYAETAGALGITRSTVSGVIGKASVKNKKLSFEDRMAKYI